MTTSAEERAAREGLPVVRMVSHEVLRVLTGNPMIVGTADGGEVLVRLFTAEEFVAVQNAAADRHGAPRISLERARELTKPLRTGGVW